MIVGVISDTHGQLRPEAVAALEGVELILHAGDVGDPEILRQLERLAPVQAVRGNVDYGPLAHLPYTRAMELEGVAVYMIHILDDLDLDPAAAGVGLVISGHTHQPRLHQDRGVTYLNPGSAGPRRFSLPVTLARVELTGGAVLRAELLHLVKD